MLGTLEPRTCPICGSSDDSDELFPERIGATKLRRMSYSSRKAPEYANLRMVICHDCDLLYAPCVPSIAFLAGAYSATGYASDDEAGYAATGYAEFLRTRLRGLPDLTNALEIGSGNGALLSQLVELGFEKVTGVEPSKEAALRAPPSIRPFIRIETFDPDEFPSAVFSLVIANQTLEHVSDPFALLAAARRLLKPRGAVMIVSHNYRHWLMQLLGASSPIIDIEHLQIFSPESLATGLRRAGFTDVEISPYSNRYPLHYWFQLTPVPAKIKRPVYKWLRHGSGTYLGHRMFQASVGNMAAWAST